MQQSLIHAICKLKKSFPYKDKQPHLQQFNVIYQPKSNCGAWTNRQKPDHQINNYNIDLPLRQETDVAKYQVGNPTHKIDFNNCAILGFSNLWRKCLIK